jgi:hypothetical protein
VVMLELHLEEEEEEELVVGFLQKTAVLVV